MSEATATTGRFLTYEQASQYSGISRWTLARKVKAGELKVVRVGRNIVRFDMRDMDRWLESRKR